jgi:hypothetical protein
MLDRALVQTARPAPSPSTVAEVRAKATDAKPTDAEANDAHASRAKASDSNPADSAAADPKAADPKASELTPAKPARRTWGGLALIAAALALFVAGLIRSRFDSARPTPLREAA